MKNNNFKQKYIVFLVMICFIAVGLYYSYAIFVSKQLQENVTYVKTASSLVKLSESEYNIPKLSQKEVTMTLTNSSQSDTYYEIFLKKDETNIEVTSENAKGHLNGNESIEIKVLIDNKNNVDVPISFFLKTGDEETIDKEIKYSYINVTKSFDHSNANKPKVNNNYLIPVIYKQDDDKNGNWYKADEGNTDSLWYDYDSGIWANAVLVREDSYKAYQKANVNTIIKEEDILGFFVWIPRFKYVVLNNDNYTNYEQLYNVIFEKNNNSTGTISCTDKISTMDDTHLYSEVCHDVKYNKIYDNLSSYTHPAFYDREGFWVSKFLISEGNGYQVIPDATMLKKNILDAITIGESVVDNNTHLLTNMEYASITILTNSQYGKSNNTNYFNQNNYTFKRVYNNSNIYNITGCSSEYNNFSKSFITTKTKNCIPYNDLTDYTHISNSVTYNIGEVGSGASTTGTIYGVYDMANTDGELVAGFVADKDGNILYETPYYDVYSYMNYIGKISSSKSISNLYAYKLGDAIKENFRTITEYGMWQGGTLEQMVNSGVILRGGKGDSKSSSIYTATVVGTNYEAPFRVSIF